MTDKEWSTMVDLAVGYMSLVPKEQLALDLDSGMSVAERYGHATRIRRKYAREILRLALSPEEALGAAQRG